MTDLSRVSTHCLRRSGMEATKASNASGSLVFTHSMYMPGRHASSEPAPLALAPADYQRAPSVPSNLIREGIGLLKCVCAAPFVHVAPRDCCSRPGQHVGLRAVLERPLCTVLAHALTVALTVFV